MSTESVMLIPKPQVLAGREGSFELSTTGRIVLAGHAETEQGELLAEYLWPLLGASLPVQAAATAGASAILLEQTGVDQPAFTMEAWNGR